MSTLAHDPGCLSTCHIRQARKMGLRTLIGPETSQSRHLSLLRLTLEAGDSWQLTHENQEAVLVLLQGAAIAGDGRGHRTVMERADPFTQRASAIFLPQGQTLHLGAQSLMEAIIITAPLSPLTQVDCGQEDVEPIWIGPDEVHATRRGQGSCTRWVHNLFVEGAGPQRLMVGETFTPGGRWSSYPPHKHDGRNGEPELEEVYYYRSRVKRGFGLQRLYTADGEDVTFTVQDGDAALIPYGYHPVSAAPGYDLYYLWALAGQRRELSWFTDPDYEAATQAATHPG